MRTMEIPPFPSQIQISDVEFLTRSRLRQQTVLWPHQAIPLAAYMCWPNDEQARARLMAVLRSSSAQRDPERRRLRRIQHEWLRVADIFHFYSDIAEGAHQLKRGGSSIGKAITLVAESANSRGTAEPTLWAHWKSYKDVAHLIAAAVLICANARHVMPNELDAQRKEEEALRRNQYLPFQMVMLFPELVLAVGLAYQDRGLKKVTASRNETALDPVTAWRIPPNIKVYPLPPPTRVIRQPDIAILNARRAGNRGKANRRNKTTLISA
jgi:hypothetical protein